MPQNFYILKNKDMDIKQGDIFKNLPNIINDFLIEAKIGIKKPMENNHEEILNLVLNNGEPLFVESIILPSWGILASQDCDIRSGYNLLFYSLIKTKKSDDWGSINDFIDNAIKDPTRKYYLPKLKLLDNTEFGPFQVNFQNPFIIPYDILAKQSIISRCWMARIFEPARRIFIGKLTNFFSRTPIDEVIFLENEEITNYIDDYWKKKVWDKKKKYDNELLEQAFKKILEIKKTLNNVGRISDLAKIYYHNNYFIKTIKENLIDLNFGIISSEFQNIIEKCDKLLKKDLIEVDKTYIDVLETIFLNSNSILNQYNSYKSDIFKNNIEALLRGELIHMISDKDLSSNEIKGLGYKAQKAMDNLNNFHKTASKYKELMN